MSTTTTRKHIWKLSNKQGRHIWYPKVLDEGEEEEHTFIEKHVLSKPSNNPHAKYENKKPLFKDVEESLKEAMNFYTKVQMDDGHWGGDYGGPMFLLPGHIICCYIMGIEFPKPYNDEMTRYMLNHQRKDGGWGLHIEGHSTMFGTCLQYLALRLLGLPSTHSAAARARAFINREGGPGLCPQWGKFYMCALNVFSWKGIDPIPTETWSLPTWVPYIHPSKWWCHTRVVFVAMGYIYCNRFSCPINPLILELRKELFPYQKFENIKWESFRGQVHDYDNYFPAKWPWKVLKHVAVAYENWVVDFLPFGDTFRKWGNEEALKQIKHEDEITNHICIGPVNKVLNMLAVYFAEGFSKHTLNNISRLYDYLWLSDDGMKYQGVNGSQLWDTAFAAQAIANAESIVKDDKPLQKSLENAERFIAYTQIKQDPPEHERYYRQISKGAWSFSTFDHGWTVSDCTAEGLKSTLMFKESSLFKTTVPDQLILDSVNVILSMFNPQNGGWATYETSRTTPMIEYLNPAALFGEIMIDYPHIECTSACMTALLRFKKQFPNHRTNEIDHVVKEGIAFLRRRQQKNGGWYGCWAVCYCYAAWFAIGVLSELGGNYNTDDSIKRGCDFLVERQLSDGGWGESVESCVQHRYVSTDRSLVVSTSWVLLALMIGGYPDKSVIDKGIELLRRRQMPNGDFPQENICGIFNHNCAISYSNYRNIFPIWALSEYHKRH
mmetsp:Transcript_6855/g.10022  ORF Transcript_6855/g.10022 Transcript_6855/m.10022 type:complete len:721 (+) Transcript_6855:46-2208(+)